MIHHRLQSSLAAALLGALILLTLTAAPRAAGPASPAAPWPAVDALGRTLPVPGEAGAPRPDRYVGIFYFLTLGRSRRGPIDLSKILPQDPEILKKPASPLWGAPGAPYWWGEPLIGYYCTTDPWVLRRHAHLLADAGIDTLIFDTTNRVTYRDVYMALCEVFAQVRREGGRTPQICFMVNTRAGETALELYRDLYQPGLYKELWFQWQGKPLMICDPAEATPELRAFFTLRKAHWPFTLVNTHNEWHWESTYPQVYSYDGDPAKPEMVNVAVAQNLRASDGKVTNMSEGNARGRGFHDRQADHSAEAIARGANAGEQWRRALELDPPFVMVTGWNEWTAGKYARPGRPVVFVDQFDAEFSRDIEPARGGFNDNYYYQLAANVRRYKGAAPMPAASGPVTIPIAGDFAPWRAVTPEFTDHLYETLPRDYAGAGALHYTNRTGRNDLAAAKVARDAKNIYFYVRTRDALTSASSPNWMWLMIDADRNPKTGWEGFDFIVNRTLEGGRTAWLEKNTGKNAGGWNWQKVAPVEWRMAGSELQLAIPRAALGLAGGGGAGADAVALDFKWADNVQRPGDPLDFYESGDTAPDGRFRIATRPARRGGNRLD